MGRNKVGKIENEVALVEKHELIDFQPPYTILLLSSGNTTRGLNALDSSSDMLP